MKAIIEFDLNDYDDIIAHKRAVKALDMAMSLWEIVHNTKKSMSYKIERALEEDKNFTPFDSLDIIYDAIYDILNENNVDIDELIV
jgi:hypothetical protein